MKVIIVLAIVCSAAHAFLQTGRNRGGGTAAPPHRHHNRKAVYAVHASKARNAVMAGVAKAALNARRAHIAAFAKRAGGALLAKYAQNALNAKKAGHSKYALRAIRAKYAMFARRAQHLVRTLPPMGKDAYDLSGDWMDKFFMHKKGNKTMPHPDGRRTQFAAIYAEKARHAGSAKMAGNALYAKTAKMAGKATGARKALIANVAHAARFALYAKNALRAWGSKNSTFAHWAMIAEYAKAVKPLRTTSAPVNGTVKGWGPWIKRKGHHHH